MSVKDVRALNIGSDLVSLREPEELGFTLNCRCSQSSVQPSRITGCSGLAKIQWRICRRSSLTRNPDGVWSGEEAGDSITVSIVAGNTRLAAVHYNGASQPVVNDNNATLQIVSGTKPVVLVMLPVQEDLEIRATCDDGTSQHVQGFRNQAIASFNFWEEGK